MFNITGHPYRSGGLAGVCLLECLCLIEYLIATRLWIIIQTYHSPLFEKGDPERCSSKFIQFGWCLSWRQSMNNEQLCKFGVKPQDERRGWDGLGPKQVGPLSLTRAAPACLTGAQPTNPSCPSLSTVHTAPVLQFEHSAHYTLCTSSQCTVLQFEHSAQQ